MNTCSHYCSSTLPEWSYLIEWLPWLIIIAIIAILAIIAIFAIKYDVEYNKTNKDYLLKSESQINKLLAEIKKIVDDSLAEVKANKEGNGSENSDSKVDDIVRQNQKFLDKLLGINAKSQQELIAKIEELLGEEKKNQQQTGTTA